jgi:YHS domain-containing protein
MNGATGSVSVRALGTCGIAAIVIGLALSGPSAAQDKSKERSSAGRRSDQEALKSYSGFVGSWRGVGQVERGRPRGAWQESSAWAWKLTNDSAALEVKVAKGKYLKSGVLRPEPAPGTFAFEATLSDGSARRFLGKSAGENKPLVLLADAKAPAEGLRRITLTPLHDTRLLVLLESEDAERHTFSRLGEVGYTREGVAFAAGESYPLCIVTEGRGTIQVSYKGKTYWVCCSGCRDLFNDDPESVLAEAAAKEKAKGKK